MLVRLIIVYFFKISWVDWTFIILYLLDFYLLYCILVLPFLCNIYLPKSPFPCKIYYLESIDDLLSFSFLRWYILHFNKVLKHFSLIQIIHLLNLCHCLVIFVPVFLIISNVNKRTKYFRRKDDSKCFSILFNRIQKSQ